MGVLRQLDDHFDQNATVYKGGVVFALIGAVYYSFIKVFKKDPLLLFKSPSGKPFREKESLLPKEYTIGPKKLKKTMSDIENNVKNGTWVKLSKLFHRKSAKTDTEQNKLLSSQSDSNSSKDISGANSNAKPFKKSNISLNKLFRKKPSRPSSKPSSEPLSEPPSKSPSKTPSKTSSKTPSKTSSKTSNKSNELSNKPQEPSQIEKLDKNKKTDNVNSTSYSFSPIQQRDKLYKFFTIQFEN